MMMNDSFYSRWMQDERKANLKQENHKVNIREEICKNDNFRNEKGP